MSSLRSSALTLRRNHIAEFKNVSVDHRPDESSEKRRLRVAANKGDVFVSNDHMKTIRLYPGGLAVSRTIGDVCLTSAAIATPDVYKVEINLTKEMPAQRFVLGTDGIFDSMETGEITKLIREEEEKGGGRLDSKTLAKAVLAGCLIKCGCKDDMTVMVVDVELKEGERQDANRI